MLERTVVTVGSDLRRAASLRFHQEVLNTVRDVVVLVVLPTTPASIIYGSIEALVEEGSAHRHEIGPIRVPPTEQPSLIAIDRQSSEVLGKLRLTDSQARELSRAVLAADRDHPLLLEMLHNLRSLTHVKGASLEAALAELGEARASALAHGTEVVFVPRIDAPVVSTGIARTSPDEVITGLISREGDRLMEASTRDKVVWPAPEATFGRVDRRFREGRTRLEGRSKLTK